MSICSIGASLLLIVQPVFSSTTLRHELFAEVGPVGEEPAQALLDAATAKDILSNKDCAGIRFYSAMDDNTATMTMMAVGIDDKGADLDGSFISRRYKLCASGPGVPKANDLSRSKAEDAITLVKSAGSPNYSASFVRSDIQAMLDKAGCVALMVSPAEMNGSTSVRVAAVGLQGDKVVALGSGDGYEKICGDPCPAFCGPEGNYLQPSK